MRSRSITVENGKDADLRIPMRGVRQALFGAAAELLVTRPRVPAVRQAGAAAPGLDLRDGTVWRRRRRRLLGRSPEHRVRRGDELATMRRIAREDPEQGHAYGQPAEEVEHLALLEAILERIVQKDV